MQEELISNDLRIKRTFFDKLSLFVNKEVPYYWGYIVMLSPIPILSITSLLIRT